jgi:hypothetical protein
MSSSVKSNRFFLLIIALHALANLVYGQQPPKTMPYRFLVPEGYVGWIRVDFDVAGAPAIPIEDGFYVFKFSESGRLQTSSSDLVDSPRNQFFYYSSAGKYRLKMGGPMGGRLVQQEFSGPGAGHLAPIPNHYRYIFIGPVQAFEKYEATEPRLRPVESDGYPKVGAQMWLSQDDLEKMNARQP